MTPILREDTRVHRMVGRGLLSAVVCGWVMSLSATAVGADSAELRAALGRADQAMAEQDYAAASDAYRQALKADPAQPGVAYNLGVAEYKQGLFEDAKQRFTEVLRDATGDLEARAKFNLGNIAYARALQKQQAPPEALQLLRSAVAHYRDALEVSPDDQDARANIESAWTLIKELQQRQQESQDDQQKKPSEDKKNEDPKEDKSRDDHQDQNQQKESSPQSRPSQDADQQQTDRNDRSEDQQPESSDEESKAQQPPDEKKQQDSAGTGEDSESQDAPKAPARAKQMSREEAERLLQSVRDRERARRMKLVERARQENVRVKRDW